MFGFETHPINIPFFFTRSKVSFHFVLLCIWVAQNMNIHNSVVLSPRTLGDEYMDAHIYLVAYEGHVFGLSVYETTTWLHNN
jgi:hypothetical protein